MLSSFADKLKVGSPRNPLRHKGSGGHAQGEKVGRWEGELFSFFFIRLKRCAPQSAAGGAPLAKRFFSTVRLLLLSTINNLLSAVAHRFAFYAMLFALCSMPSTASAGSVTVAWDANQESDLKGYILYYGSASGNYTSNIDIGNQTQYTITDLQDGVNYYFAVTAYNDADYESDYSEELPYIVGRPNNNPTNPNTPNSPSSGYIDTSYNFNTSASDPDGDPLEYKL